MDCAAIGGVLQLTSGAYLHTRMHTRLVYSLNVLLVCACNVHAYGVSLYCIN